MKTIRQYNCQLRLFINRIHQFIILQNHYAGTPLSGGMLLSGEHAAKLGMKSLKK
jgi:hypothetical protein